MIAIITYDTITITRLFDSWEMVYWYLDAMRLSIRTVFEIGTQILTRAERRAL
jgi:hypothetical protein